MRIHVVGAGKFSRAELKAMRDIERDSRDAFEEILGFRPFVETIHAMTQSEIAHDSGNDGGAGYMEIRQMGTKHPQIKIAIAPGLGARRTKEVWVEEQAHAIAPELSERIVRGTVVPEIMRRSRR